MIERSDQKIKAAPLGVGLTWGVREGKACRVTRAGGYADCISTAYLQESDSVVRGLMLVAPGDGPNGADQREPSQLVEPQTCA